MRQNVARNILAYLHGERRLRWQPLPTREINACGGLTVCQARYINSKHFWARTSNTASTARVVARPLSLHSGEYSAVTVPGANLENVGDISWREPPLAGHFQNEIPETANLAFASRVSPNSLLFANAAPARRLPVESAERIDVLIVNLIEAKGLTGHNNPATALTALASTVRGAVVLTRGANGAILLEDGQMTHHPAFSTKVVSTHGAGDMFTGALAAQIAAGNSLQSALRFAQAAAGLFVSPPVDRRFEVTDTAVEAFLPRK